MTKEETSEGNKIIAAFMGYVHYEPKIFFEFEEYSRKNCYEVFSKIPIAIEKYNEDCYIADLPNPDYGNENNPKWNPSIEKLSWATLNFGQYKYKLEYDSDFNQLMEVVDRIHDLENEFPEEDNNFHIIIGKRFVRVIHDYQGWSINMDNYTPEDFKRFQASSTDYRYVIFDNSVIYALWTGTVELIKRINQQKIARASRIEDADK